MRHAWLIIAHNEFEILQRLVTMLDAPESDFYIHYDKKVQSIPVINTSKGRLFVLDGRIDVRWGSVSQIRCEYALFEVAAANGSYDFFHIISGTTLPLEPFPQLDAWFMAHAGKNIFSGLCQDQPYQETLKVRRYNLFLHDYTSRNTIRQRTSQFLWRAAIAVQRILGIEANRGKTFYKASNWISLTDKTVRYLLSRKKEILKTYRFSFCGDEYFVPSTLMASPLRDTLVCEKHYLLHSITRSNANTYRFGDYEDLCKTGYLFARKFTDQ